MITPRSGLSEEQQLLHARHALQNVLTAAFEADPTLSTENLTTETIEITAPYAREARLLAGTVGAVRHVLVIGIPRAAGAEYRKGAELMFLGDRAAVADTIEEYLRLYTYARSAPRYSTAAAGEDLATYRSSFLLGFRLAISRPNMDADEVNAAVASHGTTGVRVRSTGTGGWAGYYTARQYLTDGSAAA